MSGKLVLGLLTAVLLIGDVSAQSSARPSGGSSSRSYSAGSNNAAAQRKKEKMEASEISKIARKIEKGNFTGIKLETTQKKALKELVKNNYEDFAMVEQKMVALIPADKAEELRRRYSTAIRRGSSATEAMLISMEKVGFAESLQDQIMTLSGETDAKSEEIAMEISDQLNPEQKEAYMAMVAEKEKAMMTSKEEMAGDTMEGDKMAGEKMDGDMTADKKMESAGSGAKAGSAAKAGSSSK